MKFGKIAVLFLVCLSILSTASAQEEVPVGFTPAALFKVEVLNTIPHDPSAYTQGLLWHDGSLYESTGREGESTLREVNPETGEVIRSIPIRRKPEEFEQENPPLEYFAEGLELVGDRLIQLTWKAEEAFIYDLESFERLETIQYSGQGWGICSDDRYYYMSDGTQYLTVREIESFDVVVRTVVTMNGYPINRSLLNELECVGDEIYANLYMTNYIARIDRVTGNVTAVIDASELLTPEQTEALPSYQSVLNGIAYRPETDTFFITGKYWPSMFEVRFLPDE